MTHWGSRLALLACLSPAALLSHSGCANPVFVEPIDGDEPDDQGVLSGLGGAGSAGKISAPAGSGGKAMTSNGGKAGTATAGRPSGGTNSGGKGTGDEHGGSAGTARGGSSGGSGGSAGNSTGGAQGGSLNQTAMCDEATATVLGTMSSNVTVPSNVCLKMSVAADQTWIKKITMQPEGGMYPLPYTWSNCGTNSSGAFTANYANQILTPINLQCPVLVKLGGNGSPVGVQWWGG